MAKEEGTEAQQRRWEKTVEDLTAKEKRLEADVRECRQQVQMLQDRLTAPTQPGNDFVTRRWGRRVVCTWGRVDVVVWVLFMCCYCFTLID